MITRSFGKVFRGKATPFQLLVASLLGSWLAFLPGFMSAPGLMVFFLALLLVMNANLAWAAMVGVVAKLLSLLLMPVSFEIGRWLLDGPTQDFFRKIINMPVLALGGFEYYATTGGLVLGTVFGLLSGWGIIKAVGTFRKKMATLEAGSEKFKAFTGKKWVKFLNFIFIGGGRGKATYQDVLGKRIGNPIRVWGVVLVLLLGLLGFIIQQFAGETILTAAVKKGLERANGATVDLERADMNFKENRLEIDGLAMADPNDLDTDIFRAQKLHADISGMNLLRKRLQLDQVVVSDASLGAARDQPGEIIGKPPQPKEELPPSAPSDAKTIDDYIKNAKEWKERLAQVKKWLEKISGPEEAEPGKPGEPGAEEGETLRERLERQVREKGYANVRASHLIEGSPTLLISELRAEKVKVKQLEDETLDVTGENLSTHPRLVSKAPRIRVQSSKETIDVDISAGGLSSGQTTSTNQLAVLYRGLPVDKVADQLAFGGTRPIQGGTIDLEGSGLWKTAGGVYVDLPLQITLRNSTIAVAGGKSTKVEQFIIPVQVRGSLDNPQIIVNNEQLTKALAKAGVSAVTQKVRDEVEKRVGDEIKEKLGDKSKGLLDGVLGGGSKKDENQEE